MSLSRSALWVLACGVAACAGGDKDAPPEETDTPSETDTPAETDTPPETDTPVETDTPPPVDADGDGATADVDCDDGDAAVFPGAEERCDGVDQDCAPGEDGVVTFTPEGGAPVNVPAFATGAAGAPAAITLDAPGSYRLCPGTYVVALTVAADGVALVGEEGVTLDGGGQPVLTDRATRGGLALTDLRLTGGVGEDGGAVSKQGGRLSLERVVIDANQATRGGGLWLRDVETTLRDVTIQDNGAGDGGGLYAQGGTLDVVVGRWSRNAATGDGGGALLRGLARASLDELQAQANTAEGDGGALALVDLESAVLEGSTQLRDNSADRGGGLSVRGGAAQLSGILWGNAADRGGGLYVSGGATVGVFADFLANSALTSGAAATISDGTATWAGGAVEQHNAPGARGTIAVDAGGELTLSSVDIHDNTVQRGGGVAVDGGRATVFAGTQIHDNIARGPGGGVWASGGALSLFDLRLSDNASTTDGGGLYVSETDLTIRDLTLLSNQATGHGGGMFVTTAGGTWTGVDASLNVAGLGGGGVWAENLATTFEGLNLSANVVGSAMGFGGGLGVPAGAFVAVRGGTWTGNFANDGGGLYVAGQVEASDVEMSTNSATDRGGAAWLADGALTLTGGSVHDNTAARGGGVYLSDMPFALLTLEAATFANNQPFDVDAAGNGYAFVGAQTRTCTAGGCE